MPILPMSCIGAATSSTCTVSAPRPRCWPISAEYLRHPHQVIAGRLVAELAGLGELGERLELALVDLGDRLVDLVLQHARLVGQHDLVPAQLEQVGAAGARLVVVERLDQEIGGAGLERVVADLAVVDDGDHDDRHVDAMGQGAQLLDELDAVEFGQLVIGEDDVDAVVARELERARRRVEQLEVQLAVDLPDDLGEQQAAARTGRRRSGRCCAARARTRARRRRQSLHRGVPERPTLEFLLEAPAGVDATRNAAYFKSKKGADSSGAVAYNDRGIKGTVSCRRQRGNAHGMRKSVASGACPPHEIRLTASARESRVVRRRLIICRTSAGAAGSHPFAICSRMAAWHGSSSPAFGNGHQHARFLPRSSRRAKSTGLSPIRRSQRQCASWTAETVGSSMPLMLPGDQHPRAVYANM